MTDLFSDNAAMRQIERAFVERLVRAGAKRATAMGSLQQQDDEAEAAMNMLESGVFDAEIAEAITGAEFAPPVAFDDLKELDIDEWVRRRGIKAPTD